MKKGDILIIVCAVILALLPLLMLVQPAAAPAAAVIRINGKVVRTLPLDMDAEEPFTQAAGTNTVVVKDGIASIAYADCPDNTCVSMGGISRTNETLVCLPHHLTVTIEGAQSALDAVTQ